MELKNVIRNQENTNGGSTVTIKNKQILELNDKDIADKVSLKEKIDIQVGDTSVSVIAKNFKNKDDTNITFTMNESSFKGMPKDLVIKVHQAAKDEIRKDDKSKHIKRDNYERD